MKKSVPLWIQPGGACIRMRCPLAGWMSRITFEKASRYPLIVLWPSTTPPSLVMLPVAMNALQASRAISLESFSSFSFSFGPPICVEFDDRR